MSRNVLLEEIESKQLKSDIPSFKVGDNIKVHIRIIEGEKERIQIFTGTVIARKGSGLSETFSLYRVSYSTGIERVFSLHSPRIAKIEVVRLGKVRRAKLYYLRGTFGKAAKVKEMIGRKKEKVVVPAAEAPAPEVAEKPPAAEKAEKKPASKKKEEKPAAPKKEDEPPAPEAENKAPPKE